MAVSGTISQTQFLTRQVIDHAFRRCRLPAQLITSEHIQIAQDLLYLLMGEFTNDGVPLWCVEKKLLPLYEGTNAVECPDGTVDVLNLQIRSLQRLSGTTSSSEGTADNATDSDVETACTQTSAGGNITITFESETNISNLGILPAATGSWNISVQTSTDGSTWTTVYANTAFTAANGEWQWIDLYDTDTVQEGTALNAITYVRLLATAPTILNVREFFVGNNPSEIPMARINKDDYQNLPNKAIQGRPVQYWLDIQRDNPVIRMWPAVQLQFTFNALVLTRKRYLMDVGTLTETLDFPQRWFEAIVSELAARLAMEVQEVDVNLIPVLRGAADRAMRTAWDGEEDASPVYFRVNLRPYTH